MADLYPNKALIKTAKSAFDLQVEQVDKITLHKTHKGISFAILTDNKLEYINIPSTPAQEFNYSAAYCGKKQVIN